MCWLRVRKGGDGWDRGEGRCCESDNGKRAVEGEQSIRCLHGRVCRSTIDFLYRTILMPLPLSPFCRRGISISSHVRASVSA